MTARARHAMGPASILLLTALLCLNPTASQAGPLEAVVGVHARIPADARTAAVLGTEREGSGVVIGEDGLVLTIGYLIMEAESTQILLPEGLVLPAEIVAYDYDSGFGLLKPLGALDIEPVALGNSKDLKEESPVLVASFARAAPGSAAADSTAAYVVSRRAFAGYWEYLLPDAIFTTPPHRGFGGAALLGPDGKLLGIGSLVVGDVVEGTNLPGNMFVPIDALKPIFVDLLAKGRAAGPVRPWLGFYSEETRGRLFVSRVAPEGPAQAAGLEAEDLILAVKGEPVTTMAELYRKIWALGEAGVEVPLTVLRGTELTEVTVTSGDRYDYLKLEPSY